MSIVETRPPTLDEWNKYELHHRARLAIKPGITGMWQVSGRSEIGEGIDVEMYLESPAHLLTYKGEEMTDVVEQSSIREDLGKYDFMALIRKPMIAVWMDTEQREWEFENKEEADSYYAVKTLSCTNLVQIFALGLWMVKDCSVYSDLSVYLKYMTLCFHM